MRLGSCLYGLGTCHADLGTKGEVVENYFSAADNIKEAGTPARNACES